MAGSGFQRSDGSHFDVVEAERRGDRCFAGKKGWYWHDFDEQWGIDEQSVTGPFVTDDHAHAAGVQRLGPDGSPTAAQPSEAASQAPAAPAPHGRYQALVEAAQALVRAEREPMLDKSGFANEARYGGIREALPRLCDAVDELEKDS